MDKKIMIIGLLAAMLIVGAGSVSAFYFVIETKASGNDFNATDEFDVSEDVYVWGYGFSDPVDVYIVPDRNDWQDDDPIAAMDGIGTTVVKRNISINQRHTKIWKAPLTIGKYDVVVDDDQNGKYDEETDFVDSVTTFGFEVLPEASTVVLMGAGLVSMIGYVGVRRIRGV